MRKEDDVDEVMGKISKVIILIGLPGSGKSSYCKQLNELYNNVRIINRDKIRLSHHYQAYDQSKEDEITMIENVMVKNSIIDNKLTVIDACHMSGERLEGWTKLLTTEKFVHMVRDVYGIDKIQIDYVYVETDVERCKENRSKLYHKVIDRMSTPERIVEVKSFLGNNSPYTLVTLIKCKCGKGMDERVVLKEELIM